MIVGENKLVYLWKFMYRKAKFLVRMTFIFRSDKLVEVFVGPTYLV